MERLKVLRNKKDLSQKDLAEKLVVSRSTIAMWETDKSEPDNDMLVKLADLFDVSIDYLLGYTDDPNDHESSDTLYDAPLDVARELNGDSAAILRYQRAVEADVQNEARSALEDPDIRMIARARNNMSEVDRTKMMKILKASFDEYFDDDEKG